MPEWSFAIPATSVKKFPEALTSAFADYRAYTAQERPDPDPHPDSHHPMSGKAKKQLAGAMDALKALVASGAAGAGTVQASVRVDQQDDAHHINIWVAEVQ